RGPRPHLSGAHGGGGQSSPAAYRCRCRARNSGRDLSRAIGGICDRHARRPQGGRRLCPARSDLSARADRRHHGRGRCQDRLDIGKARSGHQGGGRRLHRHRRQWRGFGRGATANPSQGAPNRSCLSYLYLGLDGPAKRYRYRTSRGREPLDRDAADARHSCHRYLPRDIAALEIFLPLTAGTELVIASLADIMEPSRLTALIRRSGTTMMQAPPALWRILLEAGLDPKGLKILCGGEALDQKLAGDLGPGEVWNMYGPTETTIWSLAQRQGAGRIDFGRPIANTQMVILDAAGNTAPIGVPGELCI